MRRLAPVSALVSLALLVAPACKSGEKQRTDTSDKDTATSAGKVASASSARKDSGPPASKITWLHDDYAGALTVAQKLGKPLVVDMWAPWCHTCLSMKHTVLRDPGLAEHAERFVWVALDTDKTVNAAALEKLPVSAWPTFFVVAPDESVGARFLGSASVKQFREFLDQGERASREGDETLIKGTSSWHLRAGDRLSSAGKHADAAAAFSAAISKAPADWPRRADVMVSWISALYKAGDKAACAELGKRVGETVPARSASTPDFAYYASVCAKSEGIEGASELRATLLAAVGKVLAAKDASLSADDRSDAWRIVRELRAENGDEEGAREAARTQRKILDDAAAAAANPHAAMTFNWPRSEVYVYLGEADKLVAALTKSAADLPNEYDPPYRLAWVLLKLERYEEALAAARDAESLAYGPRKGRVLSVVADIQEASGDTDGAHKTREQVLAHYEALPAGHKSEGAIKAAKAALEKKK